MRKLPEIISKEEFDRIIDNIRLEHHKLAFKLGFYCGLRVSEIVNLKIENIDVNKGFIFIKQGKGKKDRYVPFPYQLKEELLRLIPLSIGIRALQRAINRISITAIGKKIHMHTLRHSCATRLLSLGMDIKELQVLLGHEHLGTTGLYLQVNPIQLKQKFDEIYGQDPNHD